MTLLALRAFLVSPSSYTVFLAFYRCSGYTGQECQGVRPTTIGGESLFCDFWERFD